MSSDHAGPGQRYWLLVGSEPSGPYTAEQVHAKLAAGEVTWETQACPLGSGTWRPLVRTPGFGPPPAPQGTPPIVPVPPTAVTTSPRPGTPASGTAAPRPGQAGSEKMGTGKLDRGPGGWWKGCGTIPIGLILFAIVRGCVASNQPAPAPSHLASVTTPTTDTRAAPVSAPPAHWNAPRQIARINVSATDGTATLQALAAQLPPDELQALGLSVLVTGVDVYGIDVRISNTGTVPVRVFPGNLRVHYGQETVGVGTANHPLFLQPCVLQPGDSVEGLVMYQAAVDVGAVIRLQGTSFSYDDPSVTVTYGP